MATVPNYYYNSPWLADVGRNLASALAPPDQDKLLNRAATRQEMELARTKAANEATDRERGETARTAVGQMYDLQRNPVLGADGKPDHVATEKKAFELADIAMRNGPKDVRADVDDALFGLSPTFARKKILQSASINAQSDRLGRSLAGAIDQLRIGGGIKQGLQDDQQAADLERLGMQLDARMAELQFKVANAAKITGQKPIIITKQLGQAIMSGILQREKLTGNKLTDEQRFATLSEISQLTQQTRDPYAATEQVWNQKFPQSRYSAAPTQEVSEPSSVVNSMLRDMFGYDPTDTYLAPQGPSTPAPAEAPAPAAPAEVPGSLGAAATNAPPRNYVEFGQRENEMLAASRAAAQKETDALPMPGAKAPPKPATKAAPSAGTPPVSKLKEGVPRKFPANGQVWELQNGVPVRRRDLE